MRVTTVEAEVIKDAVRSACRAPSLYNSQPWRWVLDSDGRLQLFLDRGRVVPSDRSRREALIGCGAALDHLQVALAAAGWRAHVDRFPDANRPDLLASIDFTPAIEVTDRQRRRAQAIAVRRSDRLPFAAPPEWTSFESALYSAINSDAVRVDALPDDARPQLAYASQLAESLRLDDANYHNELARWTTPFGASQGIPYSSLVTASESGRVDIARVFPIAHHQERRVHIPHDDSTVLVLSTRTDEPADALATGEALSAVLLECTMAGMATCPLIHLTEVRASRDIVRRLVGRSTVPQILVRVGAAPQGEAAPPPTPRRRLDDVLQVVAAG